MRNEHTLAGKTVEVKSGAFKGAQYRVEDYWQNVAGKSWMDSDNNPAAMKYAVRSATDGLPCDNEVLYGKIDGIGHLLHVSEVE